ncbi:hypothetical protein [Geothrix campi]|uniref:hypothetical protein n=1 Tax=Geothrix campi TaxID=2966450 RepID=UPI00214898E9|nr:hypothetical protein [Geothrix sp. SG10]
MVPLSRALGVVRAAGGARDLEERDKYRFQWLACSLVDAQSFLGKKKVEPPSLFTDEN